MSFLLAFCFLLSAFLECMERQRFSSRKERCWIALGGLGGERILLKETLTLSLEVDITLGYMVLCAPEEREGWRIRLWDFGEVPTHTTSSVSSLVRMLAG